VANIHHLATLGIGTPGDIAHYVLVGLNINDVALVDAVADWYVCLPADDVGVQIPADDRTVRVPADDGTVCL